MKTKRMLISLSLIVGMPFSSIAHADDIGSGRPPPAATDPVPMETESSWWDELLESFEFESE